MTEKSVCPRPETGAAPTGFEAHDHGNAPGRQPPARSYAVELDEWRAAVAELSELERAPCDEPLAYADTYSPDGERPG
jgi:hypothetical protein